MNRFYLNICFPTERLSSGLRNPEGGMNFEVELDENSLTKYVFPFNISLQLLYRISANRISFHLDVNMLEGKPGPTA